MVRLAALCGREDSNFHGVTPTSTSSLRVYHSATTARSRPRGIADDRHPFNCPATKPLHAPREAPLLFSVKLRANSVLKYSPPPQMAHPASPTLEWRTAPGLTPYPDSVAHMQARPAPIH